MGQTIVVNWIDWITLAIVLVSILRGTRYGVLAGVLDLLAMVASFFAASVLYTRAVPPLRQSLLLPAPWAGFVAVMVIWLILYFLAGTIIRLIVGKKKLALSEVLGGLVGGIRGLALTTILLVLLVAACAEGQFSDDSSDDGDRVAVHTGAGTPPRPPRAQTVAPLTE